MNDHKRLEELRTQRELIRKHLQWLDAQIDDLTAEKKSPDESKTHDLDQVREVPTDKIQSAEPPKPSEHDKAGDELPLDETLAGYQAPATSDLTKIKVGCLVLLILSVLGFLFLLFGLPYLIY
jgi:hypothetical protein